MAEGGEPWTTEAVRMLDLSPSTYHNIPSGTSREHKSASQTPTNLTPVSSPPPRRKYATLARCSSCNIIIDDDDDPPTTRLSGSAGTTPKSIRRQQEHSTLAVNGGVIRHSASHPNGFYSWLEIPEPTSVVHLQKTSKLAFRRKSKQKTENPLHYPKNSETLKAYMESECDDDIDLNAFNEDGDGPIHVIVRRKRKKRADLLLALLVNGCSRVDVNSTTTFSGDTALHLAVLEDEELLVKTLLTFGAEVNPLNNAFQTPLDIAIDKQSSNTVAILVSVGATTGDCVLEGKGEFVDVRTLEPFDVPSDIDYVDGVSQGPIPSTPEGSRAGTSTVCNGDHEEMVFSGGAWREVILKDLEEGKASSTLFEKLSEYINCNLSFSGSMSISSNVDEAMALVQQQRELLRYRKTERFQLSITRPRAGSRVLCLDGGGLRGLIQIEVLRQLELQTGARVIDVFDWIVGTSTGGILALALVYAKKNLAQLRQLYFKLKDRVFSAGRLGMGYDADSLEEVLKEELGTTTLMTDCRHPKVLVTAVCKKTNQPELHLFNNCFDNEFSKQLVWKVARYTSAAPLFFTESDHYVDGSVLANNPCEYALTAINNYFRGNRGQVAYNVNQSANHRGDNVALVVSIGTGMFPAEELGNTDAHQFLFFGRHWFKSKAGPFQTMENLITLLTQALMETEAVAENCQSRLLQQGIPFYRFNPHLDEAIPSPEVSGEKLLNMIMQTRYQTMGVQMDQLVDRLHEIRTIMKKQSVRKEIACRK